MHITPTKKVPAPTFVPYVLFEYHKCLRRFKNFNQNVLLWWPLSNYFCVTGAPSLCHKTPFKRALFGIWSLVSVVRCYGYFEGNRSTSIIGVLCVRWSFSFINIFRVFWDKISIFYFTILRYTLLKRWKKKNLPYIIFYHVLTKTRVVQVFLKYMIFYIRIVNINFEEKSKCTTLVLVKNTSYKLNTNGWTQFFSQF